MREGISVGQIGRGKHVARGGREGEQVLLKTTDKRRRTGESLHTYVVMMCHCMEYMNSPTPLLRLRTSTTTVKHRSYQFRS